MITFKKFPKHFAGVAMAVSLLTLPAMASAATYYVDTVGNDASNGLTPATAWKTISHAATTVPGGTSGTPNIIMVAAGTYDESGNAETFPINFTHNYISLIGASSASTSIDVDLSIANALDVDAMGFSISGFTFSNALNAIDISEGGFTLTNNVFDNTVDRGINFYKSASNLSADISFPDMAITNNTFNTANFGVYVYVYQDFDYVTENLTASFGNFTVSGNTFAQNNNSGFHVNNLFEVEDILNGTVTAGDFIADNNTFTGGSTGLRLNLEIGDIEDSQVTMGNITVTNNTCTDQTGSGITIDNWAVSGIYGTTNAVFGNVTVSGNTLTVTDYLTYPSTEGISLNSLDYVYGIYDEATVTHGTATVANNTIDVSDLGIYLFSDGAYYIGEQYWGDTASVTFGSRNVIDNTIHSENRDGIFVHINYVGQHMYGSTSVNYGDFNFTGNTITSDEYALHFEWEEIGNDMYEDSTAIIGAVTVSNNTLTSSTSDALYFEIQDCGYSMEQNSTVTFGPTSISNNTISSSGGYGSYFYFEDVAYYMYDESMFTLGDFTLDNNTITATNGDGVYIEYYDYYVGSYMENYSTAYLPDWNITNNTVDVTGGYYGMDFYTYSNPDDNEDHATVHYGNMLFDSNTFNPNKDAGMDVGIYLYLEDVVEDGYGPTTTTVGDITITNNILYAIDSEAIYVEYDDVGYAFTGTPTLTMGDIAIGMNTIDMTDYGIYVYYDWLYTQEAATVTIGDLDIYDNILTNINDTGIYVDYYNINGDPDTASLTIGDTVISGNTITGAPGTNDGIYLYVNNTTDNITFGAPTVKNNTVSAFDTGVYVEMYDQDDLILSCNWLQNNSNLGMRFLTDAIGITVLTNSIAGNTTNGLSVDNGFTAVINAEDNWWGDKLGPVACASCNGVNPGDMGTVDFDPWLTYQPQKSRCGVPFPWVMFVPATTGMGPAVP